MTQRRRPRGRLHGLVEWALENGGRVTSFNDDLIVGRVNGRSFRYWFRDGWVAVRSGESWRSARWYKTLGGFIGEVKK